MQYPRMAQVMTFACASLLGASLLCAATPATNSTTADPSPKPTATTTDSGTTPTTPAKTPDIATQFAKDMKMPTPIVCQEWPQGSNYWVCHAPFKSGETVAPIRFDCDTTMDDGGCALAPLPTPPLPTSLAPTK